LELSAKGKKLLKQMIRAKYSGTLPRRYKFGWKGYLDKSMEACILENYSREPKAKIANIFFFAFYAKMQE
jgi:hypothetical protein